MLKMSAFLLDTFLRVQKMQKKNELLSEAVMQNKQQIQEINFDFLKSPIHTNYSILYCVRKSSKKKSYFHPILNLLLIDTLLLDRRYIKQ